MADDPPAFELPPAEEPAGCAKVTFVIAVKIIRVTRILCIARLRLRTAGSNR
jgi:hypothetical protein